MTAAVPADTHHGGHHVTWLKVDDQFGEHPKVRQLGAVRAPALGVWLLCACWSANNLTDGWVPAEVARRFDPRLRHVGKLLAVGLLEAGNQKAENGYQLHDWSDYQPTRAVVTAERDRWRRRKADQRKSKMSHGESTRDSHGDSPRDSHGDTEGMSRECPTGSPSPPVPVPVPRDTATPSGVAAESLRATAAPTEIKRAQSITDAYVAEVPLSKYPAILGIVRKALHCNRYSDDAVRDALLRLAVDGRAVTVDSLRTELDGMPATRARPSTTDARVAAVQALKHRKPKGIEP